VIGPVELDVVDNPLEWMTVLGPEVDGLLVDAASGDELVYDAFTPEGVGLFWKHPDGSTSSFPIPVDARFQRAFIVDDGVVFTMNSDSDPDFFEVRYWSQSEPSAEPSRIDGLPTTGGFHEVVATDSMIYVLTTVGGEVCLEGGRLDNVEAAATLSTLSCGEPGQTLWWLRLSQDGTVSYILLPSVESPCGDLYRLPPGSTVPEIVEGTGCVSRGVANADMAVWSGTPVDDPEAGPDYTHAPGYALVDGVTYSLGSLSAGSFHICSSGVYWGTELDSENPPQTRRWSPGGAIEVVFDQPMGPSGWGVYVVSQPYCLERGVGIMRVDVTTGSDEIVFLVFDLRRGGRLL